MKRLIRWKRIIHAGNDSQYHGFLAALLQRAERHREAIEHYKIALNEGSGESSWLIGLGVSLQAEGRVQEARSLCQSTNRFSEPRTGAVC